MPFLASGNIHYMKEDLTLLEKKKNNPKFYTGICVRK